MGHQDFEIALMFVTMFVGAVMTVVGVFMWQGAWAALAAFGLLIALFGLAVFNASAGRPHL
jgi:uncharacterized membrane protein